MQFEDIRTQVRLMSKAIKLLKVFVTGLQCWGSAVMNTPNAISIMDHTHFRGNEKITILCRSLPI